MPQACPVNTYITSSGDCRPCLNCVAGLQYEVSMCSEQAPVNSNLRLSSYPAGRLEVFLNGEWGTVCDDVFSDKNALVACPQLGYDGNTATAQGFAFYGQGSGRILLDDVICIGSEDKLSNCRNNGWGNHNCAHGEDVGITCTGSRTGNFYTSDRVCRDYAVRYPRIDWRCRQAITTY